MAEYISASLPLYKPTSWAGVVPSVDQAYDIRATRISETRRDHAFKRANATLCDGSTKVLFFVSEMDLNVGLAGQTAQSRYTNDFYAHNLVMPSITVKAQCLDQEDYGILVEFVHQAQRKSVENSINAFTQLEINGGGLVLTGENEIEERPLKRQMIKGPHKRTCAQGFIPRIERRHAHWEYAPIFSFNFNITLAFAGIYEDVAGQNEERPQKKWIQILEGLTLNKIPTSGKEETAKNSPPTSSPELSPSEVSIEEPTGHVLAG